MESLIAGELLHIGDIIQFTFKNIKIQGEVGHGGHIQNTTLHGADDPARLYQRIYPSLTAWSEACLREGLGEENTRYASWKRVLHMNSGRTLQSLRSEDNVAHKRNLASRMDLFEEINRLHKVIARLQREPPLTRPTSAFLESEEMKTRLLAFFDEWNGR
tara:strand:- start:4092 stop:4571 length:480 start_codon:yes stop_codon:yes gene_type:complete